MYHTFIIQVCCDWRGIALTMRDKVFKPEDEELIDIHDIKVYFVFLNLDLQNILIYHKYINDRFLSCLCFFQCKEWGFLLKKLFGQHLGTGDYGHLVVDHSAMLLRHFRSMYKYSGQGFESSHKLHRQLYSKATNHDSSGPGQSCKCCNRNWINLKGFLKDNKDNSCMHTLQSVCSGQMFHLSNITVILQFSCVG